MVGAKRPFGARNGHPLKTEPRVRSVVRFEIAFLFINAVVGAIVLNADYEKYQAWIIALKMLLQQQVFLIGTVASHTKIVNVPFSVLLLQLLRKAIPYFHVKPPNKRVAQENQVRLAIIDALGSPETVAVVR